MKILAKLRIALLVLFFLAAIGFVVFAVFFNRSTLIINSQAPFTVSIANLRSEECPESPCNIILAPGKYSIQISKTDYQPQSFDLQLELNQVLEKSIQLNLVPQISPVGTWPNGESLNLSLNMLARYGRLSLSTPSSVWALIDNKTAAENINFQEINSDGSLLIYDNGQQTKIIDLKSENSPTITIPSGNQYYFASDNHTIYYLADNPKTFLPSLYRHSLNQKEQAELLLNFIRKVNHPVLFVNDQQNQIALLDSQDEQTASLYLLNLNDKSRTLIDQGNAINNFLWLPAKNGEAENFLLEKINPKTLQPEIYFASSSDPEKLTSVSLNQSLSTVFPYSDHQVIMADPFQSADINGFNLVILDLKTLEKQTIYAVPDLPQPQRIELQPEKKTILMLIDDTIYSLSPIL